LNSAADKSTQFYWKLKTPLGIRILGIAAVVVNLVFIVVAVVAADGDWAIVVPIVAMVAAGVFGVLLALSHIYLSIDTTRIWVGLWPLSARVIPIAELERYSIDEGIRPSAFGGVGFRKAPGNKTAYLWGAGPALELQKTDGESITVVFDNAREAHEALEAIMTRKNL
jgi:hypothetical protein